MCAKLHIGLIEREKVVNYEGEEKREPRKDEGVYEYRENNTYSFTFWPQLHTKRQLGVATATEGRR